MEEDEPGGPKWFRPTCFSCWTVYSLVFTGTGASMLIDSASAKFRSDMVRERVMGGMALGSGIAIATLLTPHLLHRRRKVIKEEEEDRKRMQEELDRAKRTRKRRPPTPTEKDFPMSHPGMSLMDDDQRR